MPILLYPDAAVGDPRLNAYHDVQQAVASVGFLEGARAGDPRYDAERSRLMAVADRVVHDCLVEGVSSV
ncbi:hypothetical protein LZC95_50345 [Pendulispora brunnea]|uniref:Uncharacterized protein n=1 Tax=Pendulispora brunnea TaxID=2905690 RepID=A0ABZ2K7E0_9BACT